MIRNIDYMLLAKQAGLELNNTQELELFVTYIIQHTCDYVGTQYFEGDELVMQDRTLTYFGIPYQHGE